MTSGIVAPEWWIAIDVPSDSQALSLAGSSVRLKVFLFTKFEGLLKAAKREVDLVRSWNAVAQNCNLFIHSIRLAQIYSFDFISTITFDGFAFAVFGVVGEWIVSG